MLITIIPILFHFILRRFCKHVYGGKQAQSVAMASFSGVFLVEQHVGFPAKNMVKNTAAAWRETKCWHRKGKWNCFWSDNLTLEHGFLFLAHAVWL
jgi:hypothetical protein